MNIATIKSFFKSAWGKWITLLGFFLAMGLSAGLLVFWKGLSVTHLTDLVPWGLWITIDLSSIAMAGGAFFLCAGVYLVGLKQYEPVARTATFVGLAGYTMAMLALMLDIGRPDRFWHALIYWNHHSLLWEVTMCVCLYLTVLVLESMPILANFEWLRNRYPKLAAKMSHVHHYAPYLALVGLCLSMLHQSSLGAVYGVLKSRPFWYKPDVAVLFIMSAVAGGMSLTVFASMLSARLSKRAVVKDELLERVSYFIGWMMVAYLYFRFWDALSMTYTYQAGRTEGLALITGGTLSFNFWFGEILLGAVIPIILLLNKKTRMNPVLRMAALLLIAGGVVAYRWDTNLSGLLVLVSYLPGAPTVAYTSYRPSLVEWMAGLGIIAYGLTLFSLGVRYLRVVDHRPVHEEREPITVDAADTVTA
ncbi:MAG: NrfD/PsrC family molybdoenzyme membrane anchor subunit [Anaerolineales bacterium]|jgi:menaquinone reductase, integral membrane subunit